jgi:primosomal protein N' (replication factor Y)
LFVPLKDIGLVVVDEAHDSAYKQDQAPRYNTLRVASKVAQLHHSRLVFGSATPLISEYYVATKKNVPIVRMQGLATSSEHSTPEIIVVDATKREEYSRDPYLSTPLLNAIKNSLAEKTQSLIFLNRRGTARLVLCQNCGWQALCPNCDLPLTYHGDKHLMRCHTCGYAQNIVLNCPVCSSVDIIFRSIGTKALTASLEKLFPEARIERFDADNAKTDRLESNFEAVHSGEIDILVGTQLLIKGHDLPQLGLVGVVAADSSLYFPDYTAEEQTYELLTQVIGRVGRGHRRGTAIIQSYHPDSAALGAAITKDWDSFYHQQLEERRLFLFPPFCHILKLSCARKSSTSAQKSAQSLANTLKKSKGLIISGPSPAFIEHRLGLYHWQIVVKAKQRAHLLDVVEKLPANWTYDLDPINLL